jgi:hypothetical protein
MDDDRTAIQEKSVTTRSRQSRIMIDSTGTPIDVYDSYGRRRADCLPVSRFEVRTPPKPVGPSPDEKLSYLSDTHCRKWVRDGILAKDLDEAIAIVEAFAGRREMPITRASMEGREDSGSGYGIALISILHRGADAFLERVVTRIRSELADRGSYYDGWDYDGPGAFCKATIRIKPEGSGYVVRISAVRSDPEKRLAESFGLRRRFLRGEHHVTWATVGADYSIPLGQLARVARIAGSKDPRSAADVYADLTTPLGDSEFGCAVLHEDDSVRVLVSLDEVRVPASYNLRHMAQDAGLVAAPDDWRHRLVDDAERGPCMVGRARTWREWPDAWASGVRISVQPRDCMDPEHEKAAIAVSNDVARLWAGLPGAYGDGDK